MQCLALYVSCVSHHACALCLPIWTRSVNSVETQEMQNRKITLDKRDSERECRNLYLQKALCAIRYDGATEHEANQCARRVYSKTDIVGFKPVLTYLWEGHFIALHS